MRRLLISLATTVILLGSVVAAQAAPTIDWTTPANNATDVDPTALDTIIVHFLDNDMDADSFTGVHAGRISVNNNADYSVSMEDHHYIGDRILINLNTHLKYSTTYTVTISKRVQNNSGIKMGTTYTFKFTTMAKPSTDTTPPTVSSTSPLSNAVDVAITSAIGITFSEVMKESTITSSNITLTAGATSISGTVSFDTAATGKIATFTPSSPLSSYTTYTVTVSTGVTDSAGNPMQNPYSWTFRTMSTDSTPPTVISVTPVSGATGVDTGTTIKAIFSESMDPASITASTFSLNGGITGTVTYDPGTWTATFTPSASTPLSNSTNYTATITTGVRDLAGNNMAATKTWRFTTIQSITPASLTNYCQMPPFVSGAGSTVKPNVLLIVDNSGSMNEFAYKTSGKGDNSYDDSYVPSKNYYGYFDYTKMYQYDGNNFLVDTSKALDNTSFWSGNFLNWLTMRRVDIIRKVLVGGKTTPRSANTANYLLPLEDPDRDTMKTYNNVKYRVWSGSATEQIYNEKTGNSYNLKIYVGDQPPQDGLVLRYSDLINFGIMFYNDGYRFEGSSQSVRDGGYVAADIGSTGTNLITQIENTDPTTWTPLAETLYEGIRYFEATDSAYNGGTYSGKDPIEYKCQKNFVLILTDGESTKDQNLPDSNWDYSSKNKVTDSNFDIKTWMDSIATQEGKTSQYDVDANSDQGTYYLEGVAYYAHNTDLRSSTLGKSDFAGTQNLTIYTVFAFDDSSVGRDLLQKTAKYGGFDDFDGTGRPDQTSKWDKNGDGIPDTYYEASDGTALEQSLTSSFNDILARVSSGTAASILSNSEGSGASLLQAVFYPKKYFEDGTQVTWIGEMQNLWYYLDPYLQNTSIREDTPVSGVQNHVLELDKDMVVQFYFDTSQNQTFVQRWSDTNADGAADTYVDTVQPDNVNSLWKAGKILWSRDLSTSPRTIYAGDPSQTTPRLVDFNTSDTVNGIQTKSNWWGYLQAANQTEATKIINYINGTDQSGYRSRTVSMGGVLNTWKLGDIISSTPKIESNVRLNTYDLPTPNGYGDNTYSLYLGSNNYHDRGMAYVGANDGMLHAFKLGLLDVSGQTKTRKAGLDGTNLGKEEWAFIPKNALPYLKYLADPLYDNANNHIYYVDNTVSIVDASFHAPTDNDNVKFPDCAKYTYWNCGKKTVFTKDADNKDTSNLDLPNTSWRTILVGGMGLGGASRNSTATCSTSTECVKTPVNGLGYSSYFALDVTDPENPDYLWEFNINSASTGTLGFSTTGPAIVRVGDPNKNGRWFAVFGSGPTGPIDTGNKEFMGASDQNLKLFIVDLATGTLVKTIDTGITNAFAGSLSNGVIDTDRGLGAASGGFYQDNAVYVGYVQKDSDTGTWTKGGVIRLLTRESTDPASTDEDKQWKWSKVIDGIGPVTSSITKLQDRHNHRLWLYFGTGRYFYKEDDTDPGRALYGVIEPCYTNTDTIRNSCTDSVATNTLKDQTTDPSATLDYSSKDGWFINLDTSALADDYASERVITDPVAAPNGAVYFTTFRPTTDLCGFGGNSYLWAVRYDTGAQPPEAAMQGKALLQVSTGAFAEISMKSAFTAKNNRRTADAIPGVPPKAQGLSLLINPKPTKKILHIQER
jgi:type IV pilus assembly protein PilY1